MLGEGAEEDRVTPLEVAEVGCGDSEVDADCRASAGSSSESDSSSHSPFDLSFRFSGADVECPILVDRVAAKRHPEIASSTRLNVYGRSEKVVTPSKRGRTIVMKSCIGFGLRFLTEQAYRT